MDTRTGIETSSFAPIATDWYSLLGEATSEQAVVEFVLDYVATWSPEEIALLPHACRPARVRDGEDVSQWAFQLATTHCAAELKDEAEYLLSKMLAFATHAATRLAALRAAQRTPEASDN